MGKDHFIISFICLLLPSLWEHSNLAIWNAGERLHPHIHDTHGRRGAIRASARRLMKIMWIRGMSAARKRSLLISLMLAGARVSSRF